MWEKWNEGKSTGSENRKCGRYLGEGMKVTELTDEGMARSDLYLWRRTLQRPLHSVRVIFHLVVNRSRFLDGFWKLGWLSKLDFIVCGLINRDEHICKLLHSIPISTLRLLGSKYLLIIEATDTFSVT